MSLPEPTAHLTRGGLVTVGHGTLAAEELAALLRGAGVERLVDVRRAPGSRRHPHLGRAALAAWLPESGIGYAWEQDLGGWRSARPDSPHTALRNASFRGYADHMETDAFRRACARLAAEAREACLAIMCSESVWWRCHRRLVADHLMLVLGVPVRHLMHDGRLSPHRPTDGARRDGGRVLYDGAGEV